MPTGFGNHWKLHPLKMISYAGLAELAPPALFNTMSLYYASLKKLNPLWGIFLE